MHRSEGLNRDNAENYMINSAERDIVKKYLSKMTPFSAGWGSWVGIRNKPSRMAALGLKSKPPDFQAYALTTTAHCLPSQDLKWVAESPAMAFKCATTKMQIHQAVTTNASPVWTKVQITEMEEAFCACKRKQLSRVCWWLTEHLPRNEKWVCLWPWPTYCSPSIRQCALGVTTGLTQVISMKGSMTNRDSPYFKVAGHRGEV